MTDANHEKRIKKIEAEIVELRKQIMQLEFTSKRDHEAARKEHEKVGAQIDRRIKHISTIMGITYDELNLIEEKIQESGRTLARPRKHSTLS